MSTKKFLVTMIIMIIHICSALSLWAQNETIHPKLKAITDRHVFFQQHFIDRGDARTVLPNQIRPEIQCDYAHEDHTIIEQRLLQEHALLNQSYAGDWISLGPEGGWIWNVLMDSKDHKILYAQTYSPSPTRIFKSQDCGNSWELWSELSASYIYAMTNDPNNSLVLYLADSRYLYKSIDGGMSWEAYRFATSEYPTVRDVVVHPGNSNLIFIAGYYYDDDKALLVIYKTMDGGLNWERFIASPPDYYRCYSYCFAVNPKNQHELYIGGYHYDGSTYQGILFKSVDGGVNWTDIYTTISGYVYSLAIDPNSPNKIYAGTYSGVYRSSDSGLSWIKNNGYVYSYELAIDPTNPDIIYSGYSGSVFKSINGGINWNQYRDGLNGSCYSILVDHTDNKNVFYTSYIGIFKSSNGGVNWQQSNTGLIASRIPTIAISPTDPKTIYIEVEDDAVFKTNNYGDTWMKLPSFISCGNISAIAVDPKSPDIAYALEGSG